MTRDETTCWYPQICWYIILSHGSIFIYGKFYEMILSSLFYTTIYIKKINADISHQVKSAKISTNFNDKPTDTAFYVLF